MSTFSDPPCRRNKHNDCTVRYAPQSYQPSTTMLFALTILLHYCSILTSSFIHQCHPVVILPSSYTIVTRPSSVATTTGITTRSRIMPPRFSQKSPNNNSERHDATADTNDDANSKIMTMPEPPPTSSSHSLYHLILQNRIANERKQTTTKTAIPLAGIHDALSAKIFAQHGAPALFLSGFGVSASLLGVPDAGTTNLVEMEMITRRACEAVRRAGAGTAGSGIRAGSSSGRYHRPTPPIIADGDTGYGGSANVLRTVSALGNAGAAAITIEDHKFPKRRPRPG